MDSVFSQTLARWHDFYVLTASAAATLTGLLFVSVSIHLEVIVDQGATSVRAWAGQTLANFVFVLIIGLIFVIPDPGSELFAIALLSIGISGSLRTVRRTASAIKLLDKQFYPGKRNWRNMLIYVLLPTLCYLAMTILALIVNAHPEQLATALY